MREVVKVKRKLLPTEVVSKVVKIFPGIKVKELYDYSNEWYMAMATDKEGDDYNSPYYLVGKTNGRVCSFNPLDDLTKFSTALEHKIGFKEAKENQNDR